MNEGSDVDLLPRPPKQDKQMVDGGETIREWAEVVSKGNKR